MDFEQALRNEDTVVLKEGRDVDALGLSEDVTPKRAVSASARMTSASAGTDSSRRSSENSSQSATKGALGQMQTTKPQPGKVQTGSGSAGASGSGSGGSGKTNASSKSSAVGVVGAGRIGWAGVVVGAVLVALAL